MSYLSPHVNIASRLESATKQFGVYILFSEEVYTLLSFEIQNLCRSLKQIAILILISFRYFVKQFADMLFCVSRRVDRVTLKGSVKPLKLYTYDVPIIKLRLNFFKVFEY